MERCTGRITYSKLQMTKHYGSELKLIYRIA